jgi:Aspartyl protease
MRYKMSRQGSSGFDAGAPSIAGEVTPHLSRRRFVRLGGISLALAAAGARADDAVPPATGSHLPPKPAPGAAQIATANDAEHHLTVAVQIDGRGPFRFVVDTGADRSVLSDDVASALGLLQDQKVIVAGIIRSLPATTVVVRELSVGPVTCGNLRLPILPRALIRADGYLGLDVLDGHRVTLDFRHNVIQVGDPMSSSFATMVPPNELRVPVRGSSGHLRSVGCRADGVSSTAFIDTGAEVTVGNPPLYDALLENDPKYFTKETVPITGITGGTISGEVISLHMIRMHGLNFADCNIAIAPLPIFEMWGLAHEPAILIGMNWLREFDRVSVDYRNKILRFDLASLMIARAG